MTKADGGKPGSAGHKPDTRGTDSRPWLPQSSFPA